MTKDNEVLISDLIETLKGYGFSLHGSMIFYYDFNADLFVYCGNDPLKTNIFVVPQGKSKQVFFFYRKIDFEEFSISSEKIIDYAQIQKTAKHTHKTRGNRRNQQKPTRNGGGKKRKRQHQ